MKIFKNTIRLKSNIFICVNIMIAIFTCLICGKQNADCYYKQNIKESITQAVVTDETELDIPKFDFNELEYSYISNNIFEQTETLQKSSTSQARQKIIPIKSNINHYEIRGFSGICQLPELPTGCEATALTALMQYKGITANKIDVATRHMPKGDLYYKNGVLYGPNPRITFVGDPAKDSGLGCFAVCLVRTFKDYQKAHSNAKNFEAVNLNDTDLKILLQKYIANDYPVVVIVSQDLRYPIEDGYWSYRQGGGYHWEMNHHAMTIYGYDFNNDKIMVCDPLKSNGLSTYSLSKLEEIYNIKGKSAMTIIENE